MRKRDRVQHRMRAFFASEAPNPTSSHPVSPPSAHQASSTSVSTPIVSNAVVPAATAPRDSILEKAFATVAQKIPEAEKAAFIQASNTLDERTLLAGVKTYDLAHNAKSSFRPHAERLSKFLDLLNRFMGGVAIGIQSNPEISALVVGAVRIVIDLALKFTVFFSRLTDMVCMFEDYLGPLEVYAKAADIKLVEQTVVNAYENVITFGWKARRVFLDAGGKQRKWISLRSFMHQHWETFESEFSTIQTDLRHHLDLLLHSVQALHFDAFREAENARRSKEDRIERSSFLSWLSDIDFEKTHQDMYAKKQEGTCDWLIQEPSYKEWFQKSTSSLLWCHGKPGIGKSIHASNVIENITAQCGLLNNTDICFVYFNYRDPQLGDPSRTVTSLMKQICRRREKVPENLLKAKHDARSPSSVGTEEYFESLIENRSSVFIIFDALDECPEQDRKAIIGFITGVLNSSTSCRVKIFVASRREMDIAKAFESDQIPTIQIQADQVAPDIAAYARTQVEALRAGHNGQTLYIRADELAEQVIATLIAKADGMFLWVNLQLDNLCQVSKAHKDSLILEALLSLPRGLPDTYSRIMERIDAQSQYMRGLALKCLTWIVYAEEPLRTMDLQRALAIHADCKKLEDLELDEISVIIEACGNLVEETRHSLRPVHYTVQEFLGRSIQEQNMTAIHREILDVPPAHNIISRACLLFLNLEVLAGPKPVASALESFLLSRAIAQYAARYFDYHFTNSSMQSDTKRYLEMLLRRSGQHLAAILQIKLFQERFDLGYSFRAMKFAVSASTFVYGSLLYNIAEIRQRWLEDTPPRYALHVACAIGLLPAVSNLLSQDCDLNERDEEGKSPLYHASVAGHVEIVRSLLEQGADVNSHAIKHSESAIEAASGEGHATVVKILIDHYAREGLEIGHLDSALATASGTGHEPIVEMLLKAGANVNAHDGTALTYASHDGYKRIVRRLLNAGADVNGSNALQAASAHGHEDIVKILLDEGADVNAHGGHFGSCLQAAAKNGHYNLVTLLIQHGANVEARGGAFGSPLQAAAAFGHEDVANLLIQSGADLQAYGGSDGSPLQAAVNSGNRRLVELLLSLRAGFNSQDKSYEPPLHITTRRDNTLMAKLLLENGADPNLLGGEYGTALQAACYYGAEGIVSLLIKEGVDVNQLGGKYHSALQAASYRGRNRIVKILLDNGADVNVKGGRYGSAYRAASYSDEYETMELLVLNGAEVFEGDDTISLSDDSLWEFIGKPSP